MTFERCGYLDSEVLDDVVFAMNTRRTILE